MFAEAVFGTGFYSCSQNNVNIFEIIGVPLWPRKESNRAEILSQLLLLQCAKVRIQKFSLALGVMGHYLIPSLKVIGIYNRNRVLFCVYFTHSVVFLFFFFCQNSEILHSFSLPFSRICAESTNTSMNETNAWNL